MAVIRDALILPAVAHICRGFCTSLGPNRPKAHWNGLLPLHLAENNHAADHIRAYFSSHHHVWKKLIKA
jgi:hypothetical protein